MIQANELRIGNWIADRGRKEWQIDHWESMNKVSAKPSTSMCMGILVENHPLTEYVDYLYPIPLTEEWLLKAGFEESIDESNESVYSKWYSLNDKSTFVFSIKVTNEDCMPDDAEMIDIDIYVDDRYLMSVKSLHQLQNLYFALTGQELEFKL